MSSRPARRGDGTYQLGQPLLRLRVRVLRALQFPLLALRHAGRRRALLQLREDLPRMVSPVRAATRALSRLHSCFARAPTSPLELAVRRGRCGIAVGRGGLVVKCCGAALPDYSGRRNRAGRKFAEYKAAATHGLSPSYPSNFSRVGLLLASFCVVACREQQLLCTVFDAGMYGTIHMKPALDSIALCDSGSEPSSRRSDSFGNELGNLKPPKTKSSMASVQVHDGTGSLISLLFSFHHTQPCICSVSDV